ncbi:DUF1642 domain-containing protein [Lactococcus lactis]|uniref:DUF1642 domain-containing protein n=1 Tax=Lactococcus lactis TaxID=1358 RepID=UPI003D0A53C0
MTSFTKLIKPDSTELERYFLSVYTGNLWDALEKIKDWHSPEHIEKEVQMKLLKLQQQALPVVPNFIGEWLASNNLAGLLDEWYCHHEDMSSHIREYFERLPYKGPNNLSEMENNIVTFITRAKLDGYQVEKPQLFYLRDELTGQFLAKDNQFKDKDRYFFWTGADPLTHSIGTAWKLTFTQQEIDSMETGSYELMPVEDGE